MDHTTSVVVTVGGKKLTLETGLLAKQAAGAVTVRLGDTVLFCAVTCAATPREGIDYFPLQVEYREKYYAAGRFPGGFFKREARPAEKEILTARLTDRPIRPLFPKGFRNDVQVNCMLLSADRQNDSDALGVVAASAALTLSEIPFLGPVAGVRVGRVGGALVINPTHDERDASDLELMYCATHDLPLMIEGGGKEISEADLLAAMKFAHAECVKIIDAQLELRRKMGKPAKAVVEPPQDQPLLAAAREAAGRDLSEALRVAGKLEREQRIRQIKEALRPTLAGAFPDMTEEQFRAAFDDLEIEVVRRAVLESGQRMDGRGLDDLRPLYAQVGLLPRTHGSALFARGETQALATVTLGTKSDSQSLDAITGGDTEKTFMLHYNFPPYSTGEVGRLGFTGRREIGHGALAERSLREVIPLDYPYTVRLVSDIMESNGSSSMASVCAGTLCLMDAGIPIAKPVAGISIGLVTGPDRAVLLTDILGAEDHCGDMDFKVAGTRDGITGFQVDLKIRGLRWDLVAAAPRPELSPHAPRITTIKIDPEKIGALIGPGGKNIRRITDLSGAQIDVEDDGTVSIFATDREAMEIAEREVNLIAVDPQEGMIYHGTVTGIKEFGAFVEILPGRDGLVHVSELADSRVNSVEDVCHIGDKMWVKCIGVDDRGRVRLSRREAMRDKDAEKA